MARLARVVAVGVPHHLTQRGNNRQSTFFDDDDRLAYCRLLDEHCSGEGVEIGEEKEIGDEGIERSVTSMIGICQVASRGERSHPAAS